MEIYEKFGKDEDLAEKERTFKNNKGDTLTVTPKSENEFMLHHKATSGKEWKEKHSRVQTSNMLDRFLNKGLAEEMENEFLNEIKDYSDDEIKKLSSDQIKRAKAARKETQDFLDKHSNKKTFDAQQKKKHDDQMNFYKSHAEKLDRMIKLHGSTNESNEQLDEAKDHEYYEKLKNKLHKYGRDNNYAYVSDSFKRELRSDKKYKQWKRVTDKVTHKSFSPKEKEVLHSMLGLKMAAATKAASNKSMNEEFEIEDVINELTEGVATKYKYQGKVFRTKAFKTVNGANTFMEKNPQHGLLDIEKDEQGNEKYYHVAHVKDNGIKENSIIDNVCTKNHADAIPQFNKKIMAQVYEKLGQLFPEIASTAFNKVDEGGMFNSAKVTYSQVPHEHVPFVKKMAKKHRAKVKTYQNKHGMDMEFSFSDRFPDSFASHDSRNFKDSVKHLDLQHDTGMGLQFK
jgi:hypothetical protein